MLELAGDRGQADQVRLMVLEEILGRQMEQGQKEKLGERLAEVIKSQRHSPVIRRRAGQILVERYRDRAAVWLSEALIDTPEEELRQQYIADLIRLAEQVDCRLRENDKAVVVSNLIIALEKSGVGKEPQTQPVGRAIERITNEPLEKVLPKQLEQEGQLRARMAALGCLLGIKKRQEVLAIVRSAAGEDEFLGQLKFWAGRFGYLPSNGARFLVCYRVRQQITGEQMERLGARVRRLSEREGYRFEGQDSYLLVNGDEGQLERRRGELEEEIVGRLGRRGHTKRPASYKGAQDDYAEDFAGQRNFLSYTDLVRIKLLLDTLSETARVERLRSFLQEDCDDIESEAGGLCFLEGKLIRFEQYRPRERLGDNQYVEGPQMAQDAALSLARWHLHVHAWRGEDLAGPGVDDLQYVAYFGCPLVVVTKIKEKVCNVDYVSAEGVVVDLGNY